MSLHALKLAVMLAGCLSAVALVSGCARWTTVSSSQPLKLPAPRMSPDAVAFDIAFLHLPAKDDPLEQALWKNVDEQHMPADARRRLAANGFRSGVVGNPLPVELQRLLDDQRNDNSARLSSGEPVLDELTMQQHKQIRAGRRGEVVTSPTLDHMTVLRVVEGRVSGRPLDRAQCRFAMRSFPQGDGRVRLELVPEVHHGEVRQRVVGDERAFRFEAGRDREEFDDLRLEVTLSPGQSLLVGCTPEIRGLGKYFFAEGPDRNVMRRMLLIRLSQTQLDDRFSDDEVATPLVTPAE